MSRGLFKLLHTGSAWLILPNRPGSGPIVAIGTLSVKFFHSGVK